MMNALLLCSLLPLAGATLVPRHRISPLPARLVKVSRTPKNTTMETIDVALVSTNLAGLQQEIEDRANPESPRYAQWLSTEEVTNYVKASDEAIEKVTIWIRSFQLEPELNNHKDYLTVKGAPAWKIEALLNAELHAHYDTVTKKVVHRVPGSYSIPADVEKHISKIFPIHSVPVTRIKPRKSTPQKSDNVSTSAWPSDCQGLKPEGGQYPVSPAVSRQLYNYEVDGCSSQSTLAAMLPGPFGLLPQDIPTLQNACGLPSHPLDKFKGKNDEKKCEGNRPDDDECIESAIDAQIQATSATGCHREFWNGGEGSFISLFQGINSAGDAAPRVFSFSFGDPETERDDDAKNTDKEFAKIVAKGITLVTSSGDNGAGRQLFKYLTNYPASSPYILSVGSTSLKTNGNLKSGEVAVKDGYSSGGFSGIFTAPTWQTTFTKAYLDSGAKHPSSGFTKTGRGVPDIASLGDFWSIIYKSHDGATDASGISWDFGEGGTSTSGPFIASLVARLNAARLAKGQGTMGYMNPWLYSKASASAGALYDVTQGSNYANGQSGQGFSATKGWDPVTGLGTPNYKLLEALALSSIESVVV